MDLGLEGKVAVVTGASRGIGLAVARLLAAEGAQVVAGARTVDAMPPVEGVLPVAVDLVRPGGPEALVARAVAEHGGLDVLVNNVGGVRPRVEGFAAITDADLQATLELNFLAAVRAIRAALPALLDRRGAIVNVASVNAFFQPDGLVADYGAAKAALLNMAKALAQELGPRGVRVNSVSPGPVGTDLWLGQGGVGATVAAAAGGDAAGVQAQVAAQTATGRFSTPEEVATLVAVLASPRTANVTGADFVIDGGLVKTV